MSAEGREPWCGEAGGTTKGGSLDGFPLDIERVVVLLNDYLRGVLAGLDDIDAGGHCGVVAAHESAVE